MEGARGSLGAALDFCLWHDRTPDQLCVKVSSLRAMAGRLSFCNAFASI
jgi:hypothetical protein